MRGKEERKGERKEGGEEGERGRTERTEMGKTKGKRKMEGPGRRRKGERREGGKREEKEERKVREEKEERKVTEEGRKERERRKRTQREREKRTATERVLMTEDREKKRKEKGEKIRKEERVAPDRTPRRTPYHPISRPSSSSPAVMGVVASMLKRRLPSRPRWVRNRDFFVSAKLRPMLNPVKMACPVTIHIFQSSQTGIQHQFDSTRGKLSYTVI